MTRYYRNPDNLELTQGNVVIAVRDRGAEELRESLRFPRAVTEGELCAYIEGIYLGAKQDRFKTNPELRNGIELRCENRAEAEYLSQVVERQLQGVTPVKITYYG